MTIKDVVGLYHNISHEYRLVAMRKALDAREDKTILTYSLIKLLEYVSKSKIFKHDTASYK